MKEICVVHLVRAHNGTDPFARFLKSYLQHPGGVGHDLLIVFKGFDTPESKDEYLQLLKPFRYIAFDVSDIGYDVTAYFSVVKQYAKDYRYFCFLNSFSVIQDHAWLSKLYHHIAQPNIGLVGATGSWQSLNPWGGILQRRKMRLNPRSTSGGTPLVLWGQVYHVAISIWRLMTFPFFFSTFPNYHLRTNVFMLRSELMNRLKIPTVNNKIAAYKFESGKVGLTKQALKMGNKVLIVGKDGIGYDLKFWDRSRTFWQSDQENLLVADNQTRAYQDGTTEQRRYMTYMAWGCENTKHLEGGA